jgi:hypothetical protein
MAPPAHLGLEGREQLHLQAQQPVHLCGITDRQGGDLVELVENLDLDRCEIRGRSVSASGS